MIRYDFDDSGAVVRLTYEGELTVRQWTTVMGEVLQDARWQPGTVVLADRRRSDPPTTQFVREMADYVAGHADAFRQCRWAVVVDDIASFGMARMGQELLEPFNVSYEIFEDMASAERWIARKGP